ncbi:MAG: hypothetical protein ACI8XM_000003 [Haloarculaceae archaeon]|jgi:hypothetical protein
MWRWLAVLIFYHPENFSKRHSLRKFTNRQTKDDSDNFKLEISCASKPNSETLNFPPLKLQYSII